MKCIASFILLVATLFATVFARTQIARPKISNCYVALYDDGKATLVQCTKDVYEFTIPAAVTYQGKRYTLSIVQGNAFNGRDISIINVSASSKNLLLKTNAFKGISYLREFRFNSKSTDVEINAFPGNGILTHFSGNGVPYAVEKLITRYLKKWSLPVKKNYNNAGYRDIMSDLFLLAKNFQRNFGIYDKSTSLNSAVDMLFTSTGNVEAFPRLYRAMALIMGISEKDIMVGNDTIHQCWNYVKISKSNNGQKKWYVIDASKPISDGASLSTAYFQMEKNFIKNTLQPFYGESFTLSPHSFIVYLNKYVYPGESSPNPNYMNFDAWISQNGNDPRTL